MVPCWWCWIERWWTLREAEPSWREWVTEGGPWGFLALPHSLFTALLNQFGCKVTSQPSAPTPNLPCLLSRLFIHNKLYPSGTVIQMKPFLPLIAFFKTFYHSNKNIRHSVSGDQQKWSRTVGRGQRHFLIDRVFLVNVQERSLMIRWSRPPDCGVALIPSRCLQALLPVIAWHLLILLQAVFIPKLHMWNMTLVALCQPRLSLYFLHLRYRLFSK